VGRMTGAAMKCNIPYVKGYRDRHGRQRFYFRRRGYKSRTLPEPGSAAFLESYNEALGVARNTPASKAAAGTLGAIILEYQGSAEYARLAESTRSEMGYVIAKLVADHGAKPVDKMARRHILKMRDALKDKPGAANKLIGILKQLLSFAADRGYVEKSPAAGIKKLKGGRWRAWTDEELAQYEEYHPLGTLGRVAYALALYTSQRSADQLKIRWDKIAGKNIPLKQSKTGKSRKMPLHFCALEAIAAWRGKRAGETVLCRPDGKPYSPRYFREMTAWFIAAAGLPDDCVWHGLRKTTARILAELRENSQPVTGHASDAMRREYEADANQGVQATGAILKWERASRKEQRAKASNPSRKVSNRKRKPVVSS
jgi:integrase